MRVFFYEKPRLPFPQGESIFRRRRISRWSPTIPCRWPARKGPRTLRPSWGTRSETTTNVWSETMGRAAICSTISPRSRPSPALKEQINPSQKRGYTAISCALGSDLRRGPAVVRGLNLVRLNVIGSFGLGVCGRRVLIYGNRVLLAPFFQDLRPASPYG